MNRPCRPGNYGGVSPDWGEEPPDNGTEDLLSGSGLSRVELRTVASYSQAAVVAADWIAASVGMVCSTLLVSFRADISEWLLLGGGRT